MVDSKTKYQTTRKDDHDVRRLRASDPGQVPADGAGQDVARRLRPLRRLPQRSGRALLLQRRQTLLPDRFLQVRLNQ